MVKKREHDLTWETLDLERQAELTARQLLDVMQALKNNPNKETYDTAVDLITRLWETSSRAERARTATETWNKKNEDQEHLAEPTELERYLWGIESKGGELT